jgi:hypothetical protein
MARRLVQTDTGVNNRLSLKNDANGNYIDWNGQKIYSSAFPSKVYMAVLTQSGATAPTASVKSNGLGAPVVWTRTGPGAYVGTLVGAFPAGKCFTVSAQITIGATAMSARASRLTDDTIGVNTYSAAGTQVDLVGDVNLLVHILQ